MQIKDLSIDDLKDFNNEILLNLLIGPALEYKTKALACNESFVACVYGATITPMQRRIRALLELSYYNPNLKDIILSGGLGWLGVSSSNKTKEELHDIYKSATSSDKIMKRTDNILNAMPYLINNIAKLLKVENNPNKEIIVRQYIINKLCESDLMKYELTNKSIITNNIILESKSNNTLENAKYSLLEFKKIQESSNIKTFVIINEYPYLHRAILTTQKVARDLNIDVNILGYPASYNNDFDLFYSSFDELRYNSVNGLIPNLSKEILYSDCDDFNIDPYLSKYYSIKDNIKINVNDSNTIFDNYKRVKTRLK